jgi:sulfur carrier protein
VKATKASIFVNGRPEKVALPCTVAAVLQKAGWKPTQVVVERNGEVVPKARVATTEIEPGDKLEVIVPVAGG